ncbi:MAG: hypothetical protein HZB38_00745 [Planctomycetes bacterium]|nr:hypothetical protein [Planctomycetota bacterium]
MKKQGGLWFALAFLLAVCTPPANAQLDTAFTYQGRLKFNGVQVDGVYDFRFVLYDADTAGSQIGAILDLDDENVIAGLFTVALDFGTSPFAGENRWLEIKVRPGASTGFFTTLSPRQQVTPTPYALYAWDAGTAGGGFSLPYAGSIASALPAFSISNTGSESAGYFSGAGPEPALEAHTTGPVAFRATAIGNGIAVMGLGAVLGGIGTNATDAAGVRGDASNATGQTYGVFGVNQSSTGQAAGVYGLAAAVAGATRGVSGATNSSTDAAVGVYGHALGSLGATFGVEGVTDSEAANAAGVRGLASSSAASGPRYGVFGLTNASSSRSAGVRGETAASASQTFGVDGLTRSTAIGAAGVHGLDSDAAGAGLSFGVLGTTNGKADESAGVRGETEDNANRTFGVDGFSQGTAAGSAGVRGYDRALGSPPAAPATYGVFGYTNVNASGSAGVRGETRSDSVTLAFGLDGQTRSTVADAAGVRGQDNGGSNATFGVWGSSSTTGNGGGGVKGIASAGTGITYGVQGESASADDGSAGVRGAVASATPTSTSHPPTGVWGVTGASTRTVGVQGDAHYLAAQPTILNARIGVRGYAGRYASENAMRVGVEGDAETNVPDPFVPSGVRGFNRGTLPGYAGVVGQGLPLTGEGPAPSTAGVGQIGVWGVAQSGAANSAGVRGDATVTTSTTYGVHGKTNGITVRQAAGVRAEGSGNRNMAAALRIENGAITVAGGSKPANTTTVSGPWTCFNDWWGQIVTPPPDCAFCQSCGVTNPIGAICNPPPITNDLVRTDSYILLTVLGSVGQSTSAQVVSQSDGSFSIRVTALGAPSECSQNCTYSGSVQVRYLIINPQ